MAKALTRARRSFHPLALPPRSSHNETEASRKHTAALGAMKLLLEPGAVNQPMRSCHPTSTASAAAKTAMAAAETIRTRRISERAASASPPMVKRVEVQPPGVELSGIR